MTSASSGVGQTPWGQAPVELATNYAHIETIVDSSLSLRSASARFQAEGRVTVKYDAVAISRKKKFSGSPDTGEGDRTAQVRRLNQELAWANEEHDILEKATAYFAKLAK